MAVAAKGEGSAMAGDDRPGDYELAVPLERKQEKHALARDGLATDAEARVELAVDRVAHEDATDLVVYIDDDLAVLLEDGGAGAPDVVTEPAHHPTMGSEARIEIAVGLVTGERDGEGSAETVVLTGHDELAVRSD